MTAATLRELARALSGDVVGGQEEKGLNPWAAYAHCP